MKASYEGLYCRCTRYRVVRRACWSRLRVFCLLRVVFPENLSGFLKCRNLSFVRLAVFHLVFFLFLVGLNINPTKAFADTYIGGPYTNANDAGLSYLGYDYDNLVDETKHTALNELVGFPDRYPDYTSWVDTFYAEWFDARYYWSRVDGMLFVDMVDKARADVKKAEKAAEDYNSSSGGGSDSDYYYYDVALTGYVATAYSDFSGVALHKTYVDSIVNTVSANPDKNLSLWIGLGGYIGGVSTSSRFVTVNLLSEMPRLTDTYSYIWVAGSYSFNSGYPKGGFAQGSTSDTVTHDGKTYVLYGPNPASATTFSVGVNSSNTTDALRPLYGYYWGPVDGVIVPDPEPDPEPEPETPTAPPELPTAPDLPDSDLPAEPVVPDTPDLSDLLAALDEHCQHIQNAIYNGLDDYYRSITKYYEDVTKWLADTYKYYDKELDKRFQVLFNYLRSTNQYLKNIDDNVQEILDKLDGLGEQIGLGDIPDTYDNNNVATDGSSALSNAYNLIRNKFPFSVLDNLLTLVTSLNHDAVAPVVSLPVGNPFDSEPYMVEMDFSDWSDLAAIVRTGELVVAYLGMSKSAIKMWTGGEGEAE